MKKVFLVVLAFALLCGVALGEGDVSAIVRSHNLFPLDESMIASGDNSPGLSSLDEYLSGSYCMLAVGGEDESSVIIWKGSDGARYFAVDSAVFIDPAADPSNLAAAFLELCDVEAYDTYILGRDGETLGYTSPDIFERLESIPDSDPMTLCDSLDDFYSAVSDVIK